MLDHIHISNILFLDIETVPQYKEYEELPENFKQLWDKKSSYFRNDEQAAGDVYGRAGIYAEFGKIICISLGIFDVRQNVPKLRIKSLSGDDERNILYEFGEMAESLCKKKNITLCAHNGKEFDFPYIARRMLIWGLKLPAILDIAGKKPWETNLLDTMELWKFGDYKHYTSLELLSAIFGLSNPKDEIDGSMIAEIYRTGDGMESIVTYCEKDVIAIAQLLLKYKGEEPVKPEDIVRIQEV